MDESIIDYAKQEILLAMYTSTERMNDHIVEGNDAGVISEQHLQSNLRKNFLELQEAQESAK